MAEEKTGAMKVTGSREACAQGGARAMICDGHRQWDRSQVPAEVPQEWGGSNGIGQHPGPVGWGHSLPPADDSGFETWGLGIWQVSRVTHMET